MALLPSHLRSSESILWLSFWIREIREIRGQRFPVFSFPFRLCCFSSFVVTFPRERSSRHHLLLLYRGGDACTGVGGRLFPFPGEEDWI